MMATKTFARALLDCLSPTEIILRKLASTIIGG